MTNEELVAVIQQGQNRSENMGILYEQNKSLIHQWVSRYSSLADMEDLMQESYFGFNAAVERFDCSEGFAFATYAKPWVLAYVRRYIANFKNTKRIPAYIQTRISKYQQFIGEHCRLHGSKPTDEVTCEYLGINAKSLQELKIWIFQSECRSLEEVFQSDEDTGASLEDILSDGIDLESVTVDRIARTEAGQKLWALVDTLTPSQKNIIKAIYQDSQSRKAIAADQALSVTRICQLEAAALKQLKKKPGISVVAEAFDYECSIAYRGSVGSFKAHGNSTVEYLALKHIEFEEQGKEASDLLDQILQLV